MIFLADQGKLEYIKDNFHPYFDIQITSEIIPENVNNFVNFVLPIDKIDAYDFSDESGLRKFFNEDFSNVVFTSNNNEDLFKYEVYKKVYFIRMPSFFDTIRMHILPKKYDASNEQSETPLLLFKLDQETINENNFECTSKYERKEDKKNINLYYKESTQLDSSGMYKFDIKSKTKELHNLQINTGYSYNDTNPTNPMMLEHFTGILDESDENGNPVLIDTYDHMEIEYNKQSIDKYFSVNPFNSEDIYIDWGDNTDLEYYRWQLSHTYSTNDNHVIKIYGNITSFRTSLFYDTKGITSIIIPYGITSLEDSSFYWCTDLSSIYLPTSITSIGKNCFSRTNLKSIVIPYTVTNIGNNCFVANDNLNSIVLEWYSDSEIIPYNSTWLYNNDSFRYFIIPRGTTSLYIAKGYPSNLLKEDLKPRATRNELTEFNIALMDVNCDNNIANSDYTNISQEQKLVNNKIEWPDEMVAYDDGKNDHPIGFINSHTIDTLYHKTIKYFNDDIYIEEDGQYINNDWDENKIRGI